jgi:hypothetical protein
MPATAKVIPNTVAIFHVNGRSFARERRCGDGLAAGWSEVFMMPSTKVLAMQITQL